MRTLILHIGIGKTGTSSIQRALAGNRDLLCAQGIYYPDFGVSKDAHHPFARLNQDGQDEAANGLIRRAIGAVEQQQAHTLLLSSESFVWCRESYIRAFLAHFSGWRIRVVFYVRNQAALLQSTFLQKLKNGRNAGQDFLQFLESNIDAFDYQTRIGPWECAVGAGAISVVVYEHHARRGDVCRSFFDVLGLGEFYERSVDDSVRENPSLLPEFAPLLLMLDRQGLEVDSRALIVEELMVLSVKLRSASTACLFDHELLGRIRDRFRASNEAFARRHIRRDEERTAFLETGDAGHSGSGH